MPDLPSPIVEIEDPALVQAGVRIWLKRDDLIHPHISGNKWRKLKYNIAKAKEKGNTTLLTFGGAYSNHLAATAAAGLEYGFKTIGIVRGERPPVLNPTLRFLLDCGMQLHFVSRKDYREKSPEHWLEVLALDRATTCVLPEGGSNCLALKGCAELPGEVEQQLGFLPDVFFAACGTGATLAGIAAGLKGRSRAMGVSVLKGDFHRKDVSALLRHCDESAVNWEVLTDYHFGGYARFDDRLISFINAFRARHRIRLDPIYTGKLLFAVFDQVRSGAFPEGTDILVLHSGGLQGIAGFNERFGDLIAE
ncbi:MAG: 1-aminocyclopropane-1-carboxylate deaminase [Saprospirales bacterium]|nr:1-aminocyclopropane-1-carboxylate deaminase [Saprospirales bacterium]